MQDSMNSGLLDHYRWMARYNAWFNDRLYGAWVGAMPADFPASTLRYSNTQGVARAHPA